MTDSVLMVEAVEDGVTVLTLNRPAKRNALDAELRWALTRTFTDLASDDTCRVVVLTGAGEVFCAGFDLTEIHDADSADDVFADADAYHHAVHTFPKPLVVAIRGHAVAGGMDLALMGDIRIAERNSAFGQPQVRAGIPAAFELVRTVVADPVARELCLTGRIVDAEEAERLGLVHRLVDDRSLEQATTLAAAIASVPAAETMKRMFVATQPDLFSDPHSG